MSVSISALHLKSLGQERTFWRKIPVRTRRNEANDNSDSLVDGAITFPVVVQEFAVHDINGLLDKEHVGVERLGNKVTTAHQLIV